MWAKVVFTIHHLPSILARGRNERSGKPKLGRCDHHVVGESAAIHLKQKASRLRRKQEEASAPVVAMNMRAYGCCSRGNVDFCEEFERHVLLHLGAHNSHRGSGGRDPVHRDGFSGPNAKWAFCARALLLEWFEFELAPAQLLP